MSSPAQPDDCRVGEVGFPAGSESFLARVATGATGGFGAAGKGGRTGRSGGSSSAATVAGP